MFSWLLGQMHTNDIPPIPYPGSAKRPGAQGILPPLWQRVEMRQFGEVYRKRGGGLRVRSQGRLIAISVSEARNPKRGDFPEYGPDSRELYLPGCSRLTVNE